MRVTILMPVRDDWVSAAELIRRLDRTIPRHLCDLDVLIVDDGSTEEAGCPPWRDRLRTVDTIRAVRLRRNLGHQRAIAIGLAHLEQARLADAVLVMDADGEDTPDGALKLIQTFLNLKGSRAVFAERSRRTESRVFRIFYSVYRIAHRALTGISVRVGNFSILPARHLTGLAVVPELWNHYAAAVFRSSLPLTMTPIPRGYRIAGKSRMNFISLVTHGLSAMSVFGDVLGVRLLLACFTGSVFVTAAIAIVLAIRLFTDRAIPGWATYASGTLAILFLQLVAVAVSFTFFILSSRANLGFIPIRDYSFFVAEIVDIYPLD